MTAIPSKSILDLGKWRQTVQKNFPRRAWLRVRTAHTYFRPPDLHSKLKALLSRKVSVEAISTYRIGLGLLSREIWADSAEHGNQNPPDTSICHNPESKLFGKSINLNDFVWYVVRTGGSLAYLHAAGSSKGKTSKRMTPIEVRVLQAERHKFIEARAEDFEDGLFSPLETRALDKCLDSRGRVDFEEV